jgi:dihydrofolate reductase
VARIVVTEFVSLDGVMEDPGGAEKYEHGGWTMPYWNDEIAKFKLDELMASNGLLLGRVTYEGFAAAWPSMTDVFADRMNSMPKYVVSSTLDTLSWNNSRRLDGDLATEVAGLREQPGGDILVAGSASVARQLLHLGLVDELRLVVYPVVLGAGKRLYGEDSYTKLDLVENKTTPTGAVLMVYRPASQS